MAELLPTDLMLVNRSGTSYKVSGEDILDKLIPKISADIKSVTITEDNTSGNRFTSQSFTSVVDMYNVGEEPASLQIKAKVKGSINDQAATTEIVGVESLGSGRVKLTLQTNQDLSILAVDDYLYQNNPGGFRTLIENWKDRSTVADGIGIDDPAWNNGFDGNTGTDWMNNSTMWMKQGSVIIDVSNLGLSGKVEVHRKQYDNYAYVDSTGSFGGRKTTTSTKWNDLGTYDNVNRIKLTWKDGTTVNFTAIRIGGVMLLQNQVLGDYLPSGTIESIDVGAKTITLKDVKEDADNGHVWSANTNNYALGLDKVIDDTERWLKLDSNYKVTGLQENETGYKTFAADNTAMQKSRKITFNSTLDNGLPPDTVIMPGAAIETKVRAVNSSASPTKWSNTLIPGGEVDALSTSNPEDVAKFDAIKSAFEAYEAQRIAYRNDLRQQLRTAGVSVREMAAVEMVEDGELARSIDGYYPLYTTEVDANNAGNGTSHPHVFDNVTYYMPDGGVTIYHGNYVEP